MAHQSNNNNNLPAHLPSLIGRDAALGDLRSRLLEGGRGVLTLTGTGGSGKTRLALAIATELVDWIGFPDGVWVVDLAPLGDPLLVPGAVATSVGVKEQSGRNIREALIEDLRSRSLLLLIDNCEHVVEVCSALVDDLLRNCAGLRILATSREPLRIPGERVWRVPPLPAPDVHVTVSVPELAENPAVRLFMERAQAVQSTLTLTPENSPAIAGICARLDGLPLAIELAAARARVLTPEQIRVRLEDTFRLLVGGSRTAPTRQQTLRATLDWSYLLLGPAERQRFEQLAVFAGGFEIDGVEAMWSDDDSASGPDALDVLTGLVDRSLMTAQPYAGRMRYRLLEPVRQYAQERLMERGAWGSASRQHADYFLRLVEQGEWGLKGPDAELWQARLELEHDDVRAALRRSIDTGEAETALRIGSALRNFWLQFGYRNEGRRWLEEGLALGTEAPPRVRGNALQSAAVIAYLVGDYRGARARFGETVEHWRRLGDQAGLGEALGYYGRTVTATAQTQAEYEEGKTLMQEAIALNRQTNTLWWTAHAMLYLGMSAWEHAELDLAAATLGEAEAINAQLGDGHAQSHLNSKLGGVLRDQGDLGRAQRLIEQSLVESRAIRCQAGTAEALYFLAGLARLRGDRVLAAKQAVECLLLQHKVSDTAQLLNCVELLGSLWCQQEQPERGARLFSAAATLRQRTGVPMPPILRPAYERDLAAARGALGSNRFAARWAEGSVMTIEQVVDYARQTDAASSQPQGSTSDPLSQRERQVIALLARGYTNRQIAEELIISGRTVDGHVAHILDKLGLSTRAQAAVWAVEHPLAGTASRGET